MADEVLVANQAFYDAHEQRDIGAMRDVWEHTDRVACIHPGWPILRTWRVVEESWRRIFEGPGRNQFIVTNDMAVIDGDLAWVTLDENLVDRAATGTIAATNLFTRAGGSWKLVLHHGSPVMTR
jgi:ketosteroid isomerase-like protein